MQSRMLFLKLVSLVAVLSTPTSARWVKLYKVKFPVGKTWIMAALASDLNGPGGQNADVSCDTACHRMEGYWRYATHAHVDDPWNDPPFMYFLDPAEKGAGIDHMIWVHKDDTTGEWIVNDGDANNPIGKCWMGDQTYCSGGGGIDKCEAWQQSWCEYNLSY